MNKIFTLLLLLAFVGIHDPLQAQVIINEIHADPVQDSTGDANGDGSRSASEDEFIEFVNTDNQPFDLSNWQFADDAQIRHTFPSGTILLAGQPLVLFGGGTPTGLFGGAIVQTASSGEISLRNSGENIFLLNANGDTVIDYTYGSEASIDQSLTRNPDITGPDSVLTAHTVAANDTTKLFSPGLKVDGTPFSFDASALRTNVEFSATGETFAEDAGVVMVPLKINNPNNDTATTVEVRIVGGTGQNADIVNLIPSYIVTFPAASVTGEAISIEINDDTDPEGAEEFIFVINSISGPANSEIGVQDTFIMVIQASDLTFPLLVNEIHADPKPGLEGDANGDGTRVFQEDEFLELINIGDTAIDISGFRFQDSRDVRHTFDEGTIIPPGGVLLMFGRPIATPIDPANFCNATIVFANKSDVGSGDGLSLANGGDEILFRDSLGQTFILETYGAEGGQDQSLNRQVDGQRLPFELHTVLANDTTNLYSPGCGINGNPISLVSNDPLLDASGLMIYPNPIRGIVQISVNSGQQIRQVDLYDLQGRRVLQKTGVQASNLSLQINQAPGLYSMVVYTQLGRLVRKVVVE